MAEIERPLRFAIAGCGRIADRHAEHIARIGQLTAVCDVDPVRARRLGTQFGASHYPTVESMLAQHRGNIDVVSVCTPNGLHAEHSILSLRVGCHVLCEKPMALTVADCGQMIQEAERANRRIFVVKQNRFNPPIAALRRLIDEGRLGRIYSVQLNCFWNRNENYYRNSWKGTLDLDGGCLYTQFSHFIDLLYWFVGDVSSAHAFLANHAHQEIVDFEDCGVVALQFRSGAIGTIHFTVNSYEKNMEGSLTLFCEKGTVKIGGQYLNELDYLHLEGPGIDELPAGRPANQYGEYVGSMSNHDRVYENVVDVLTNGGVIATNAYEGLKTVEIIETIYTAASSVWTPSSKASQSARYRSGTMSPSFSRSISTSAQ